MTVTLYVAGSQSAAHVLHVPAQLTVSTHWSSPTKQSTFVGHGVPVQPMIPSHLVAGTYAKSRADAVSHWTVQRLSEQSCGSGHEPWPGAQFACAPCCSSHSCPPPDATVDTEKC